MTEQWREGMEVKVLVDFLTNEGTPFFEGERVVVHHVFGVNSDLPSVVSISSLAGNGAIRSANITGSSVNRLLIQDGE